MNATSSQNSPASTVGALHVASRVMASLLGSYMFVWGFVSLGITLGVMAGMPYEDSQTLLYLLAFLVFLTCFCWAFSARSLARVWLCFGAGGALMSLGAWAIATTLA